MTAVVYNCWETGINYYKLSSRLPEDIFKYLAKSEIWYHNEEIEEEGNWKGWCSTSRQRLEAELAKFDWKLSISIVN